MTAMIYEIGRGRIALKARLAGLRDEQGRTWNQVAVEGTWSGHSAGEFSFNREVFEQIVENFARREDTIPLTYGHPDDVEASRDGAAGWIHDLRLGETESGKLALFALMEFNDRARAQVEANEQKYCSVVVSFESVDGVTGEPIGPQLHEVGLVLSAFISGMTPLAASDAGRIQDSGRVALKDSKLDLNEILKRAQKELPEGFTRDQLVAFIDAEEQKAVAIAGAEPDEAPAEDPVEDVAAGEEKPAEVVEAGDQPTDTVEADLAPIEEQEEDSAAAAWLDSLAAELNIDMPALLGRLDESRDAVLSVLSDIPEDGVVSEDPAAMGAYADKITKKLSASEVKCGQLVQERDAANEKLVKLQFEKDVDLALFERKITDAVKAELIELHAEAPTFACKRLSAAMGSDKTVVPVGKVRNEGTPSDAGDIDSAAPTREEAIAKAEETIRLRAANEGVTLRTKDLRSQSYDLAKATSPEAFGIKTKA